MSSETSMQLRQSRRDVAAATTRSRRAWLWAELVLLFVLLPPTLVAVAQAFGVRVVFMLGALLPAIVVLLMLDRRFSFRDAFLRPVSWREIAALLAMFVPLAALLSLTVWYFLPASFLALPQHNQRLWLTIMIFYPLLSAAAQELIYRVLFFHRYEALFEGSPALLILGNAALFGYGHILFGNWVAVVLTFVGGLLFAWRFVRTRSFWAVWLEHSLYGNLAFTIGLGRFLYSGG